MDDGFRHETGGWAGDGESDIAAAGAGGGGGQKGDGGTGRILKGVAVVVATGEAEDRREQCRQRAEG